VLPCVNTQDWLVLADNRVLVSIGLDQHLAGLSVLNQPGPSAALDASKGSVKLALEVAERAVRLLNGRLNRKSAVEDRR
jgi:hypothetical protein